MSLITEMSFMNVEKLITMLDTSTHNTHKGESEHVFLSNFKQSNISEN